MKRVLFYIESHFEDGIEITLFMVLLADVVIEVFKRYFLQTSSEYSEEIAKYLLVAIVFIGVPYAIRHKRHLICDVIPSKVSQKVHYVITMVSYGLFLLFSILMVISSWELVSAQMQMHKTTPAMRLPMYWFSSLVGIGFGLGVLRLIQAMVVDSIKFKKTGKIYEYDVQLD